MNKVDEAKNYFSIALDLDSNSINFIKEIEDLTNMEREQETVYEEDSIDALQNNSHSDSE